MFKMQKIIFELCGNTITKSELLKRSVENVEIKLESMDMINIKRKDIFVIIDEEKIFIKLISLPNVKKDLFNNLIENELNYLFKYDSQKLYSYSIFKQHKTSIELLIFCFNSEKLSMIDKSVKFKKNFKAFYLIQFCFLFYFKNLIKDKDYFFIFSYNSSLYLLKCLGDNLINNKIIKNFNGSYVEFMESFNEIKDIGYEKYEKNNIKKVYFCNFIYSDIIIEVSKEYDCVDLGSINRKDMISYCTNARRVHSGIT
jgi:hypothetical protein